MGGCHIRGVKLVPRSTQVSTMVTLRFGTAMTLLVPLSTPMDTEKRCISKNRAPGYLKTAIHPSRNGKAPHNISQKSHSCPLKTRLLSHNGQTPCLQAPSLSSTPLPLCLPRRLPAAEPPGSVPKSDAPIPQERTQSRVQGSMPVVKQPPPHLRNRKSSNRSFAAAR